MKKEWIRFHLPTKLTDEQAPLVKVDLSNPKRAWWWENMIVKWYWWTGKTVVAYYRALSWKDNRYKYYNWKWDRVLLLCFNKLLNNLLKSETDYPLNCDIAHLQKFYESIRSPLVRKLRDNKTDVEFDGWKFSLKTFTKFDSNNEYYYIIYEKEWVKISENTKSSDSSWSKRYFANEQTADFLKILFSRYVDYAWKKSYKEIIIDEWQDISWAFLKSLMILTDHISIFADDHQKINKSWISIDEMKNILCPDPRNEIEELTCMMRTTLEIFEYAVETFLPDDEQANAMRTKSTCISDPESKPDENSRKEWDDESWAKNVVDLVKDYWLEWGKHPYSNVLIVCPEKAEIKQVSSLLAKNKIHHWAYFNWIEFNWPYLKEGKEYLKIWVENNSNILVTTYLSAKWLEAECVIIYISEKEYEKFINWNVWDHNDNIFYTLATRPKKKLFFVTNFPLSKYL